MTTKRRDEKLNKALVSELTLQPRGAGQTTESAYRKSLEASPSFQKELAIVKEKTTGNKRRKKKAQTSKGTHVPLLTLFFFFVF